MGDLHESDVRLADGHVFATYTPSPEADVLLARWWSTMGALGDLELFAGLAESLGAFFRAFLPPTRLYYLRDERDIVAAMWADPIHAAAFVSVWVRPDYRQRRATVGFALDALTRLCTEYAVLVTLSKSPKLQKLAERIGFTPLQPAIPWLLHGHAAYVSFMTARDFVARWAPSGAPSRAPSAAKAAEEVAHGG